MATQGKQRSIWKEKTGASSPSSSPRHSRKPKPSSTITSSHNNTKPVSKSQNNAKHRPGIVVLGSKPSPIINNNGTMRYVDVLKGSVPTKKEETTTTPTTTPTPVKELFLPSDFPVINRNHVKRFKDERNEKVGIGDIRVESTKQQQEQEKEDVHENKDTNLIDDKKNEEKIIDDWELVDGNIDENHQASDSTFVIVDSNEQQEGDKEVVHEMVINEEKQSIEEVDHETETKNDIVLIDGEDYLGQEQEQGQEQDNEIEEEKFLKPTEILKLMKAQTNGKEVALCPSIRQVIRCSNNMTNNISNWSAVKKETATSIAAYNEVIEETASKLIAEEKRNKVLALVGAFETVISLENEGINE